MVKRLLVLGGNGFVGQSICLEGVRRGWKVSSLSRSGAPSSAASGELQRVTWHRGSASDPVSYRDIMRDVDYVVHSIGLLWTDGQRTPQEVSVETCQVALEACKESPVRAFGFVSAAQFASPIRAMMSNYFAGKNDTEQLLVDNASFFERVVIARPGMLYGEGRWSTKPVVAFYNAATIFTGNVFPRAIHVNALAKALLSSLDDSTLQGIQVLEVADM